MNLSTNSKRFLIVWVIFHSFALFVNIAHIEGYYSMKINPPNDYEGFTYTYILTHNDTLNKNSFWPLTKYETGESWVDTIYNYQSVNNDLVKTPIRFQICNNHYFNGVFNSYGFTEYIFYTLVGIGIVYLPKIWK